MYTFYKFINDNTSKSNNNIFKECIFAPIVIAFIINITIVLFNATMFAYFF